MAFICLRAYRGLVQRRCGFVGVFICIFSIDVYLVIVMIYCINILGYIILLLEYFS